MIPDINDTIVAPGTAGGPAARAVLRLSGAASAPILAKVVASFDPALRFQRACLRKPELPVFVLFQKAPATYTGQDTAEIHLADCPPLVEALVADILAAGARAAGPGEYTMRGFLAGKRDLARSEAVLAVIEARDRDELKQALEQMAGGVTLPLHDLREDLLNLLADVEAGLDFADEDIEFIDKPQMLARIGKGLAMLLNLRRKLEDRAVTDRVFRVVLVGEPNAGKSSLFNALAGVPAAIVSPLAGTTRDYLSRSMPIGDGKVELVDTAGWQAAGNTIETQAQALAKRQEEQADLVLECVPAPDWRLGAIDTPKRMRIVTQYDLKPGAYPAIATSAATGHGLQELRKRLADAAAAHAHAALAPSLSRCRGHVDACLAHLRQAHEAVLFRHGMEIVSAEVRLSLDELGAMTGEVHTEDLLGRIFGRFCIGK